MQKERDDFSIIKAAIPRENHEAHEALYKIKEELKFIKSQLNALDNIELILSESGCGRYGDSPWVAIKDLIAQRDKALKVIKQHDLCHDLHGKVDAEDFAKGCIAEQKRIYGVSPTKDILDEAISLLEDRVPGLGAERNEWMARINQFLEKYAS